MTRGASLAEPHPLAAAARIDKIVFPRNRKIATIDDDQDNGRPGQRHEREDDGSPSRPASPLCPASRAPTVQSLMAAFARRLAIGGTRVAGVTQLRIQDPSTGRSRIALREVGGDALYAISQDLGPGSVACNLDSSELAQACAAIERAASSARSRRDQQVQQAGGRARRLGRRLSRGDRRQGSGRNGGLASLSRRVARVRRPARGIPGAERRSARPLVAAVLRRRQSAPDGREDDHAEIDRRDRAARPRRRGRPPAGGGRNRALAQRLCR